LPTGDGGHQGIFDRDLERNAANYQPLTPLDFLARSALIYPEKEAVIHGDRTFTYREFYGRARRLASALAARGIGRGDTVSLMAPNVPAMLEAHFGVAMIGAVLNPINLRLDPTTIAFIFEHAETKLLITDREFSDTIKAALERTGNRPPVIDIDDPLHDGGERLGEMDYEAFIATGDPDFAWSRPADEWDAYAVSYTSGTTGNPKGVVVHHRGAYLNAIGDILAYRLSDRTRYLWTLPMFHCNGWCHTWAVTAVSGTHVCLRRVDPALIFPMVRRHRVNNMSGAPIVLNLLVNAPDDIKETFAEPVDCVTGGAAPPSAILAAMEEMGFRVIHAYGLTESYGPATTCFWHDEWNGLDLQARAGKMASQGANNHTMQSFRVANPNTMEELPWDGETIGEIMLRGNTIMKGYLKNPTATREAFRDGWFHTGDLAVRHPNGYIEVKDRSKDIIISGGENISSLEVEECLYKHPAVMEAAVVARPDPKWGEAPCAFVHLKPSAEQVSGDDLIAWCRERIAHFKAPKTVIFGELPKTSTGKIQKYVLREQAEAL